LKLSFPALVLTFLILGIGAGTAFGGGVLYGRNTAPVRAAAATAAAAGGQTQALSGGASGTPSAGGQRGSVGAGSGGTAGAVDSISGNTLNVRTQVGTLVAVSLAPDTRVITTTQGTVADLKPGTLVTVIGQPDSSGAIPATAISINTTGINPLGPAAAAGGAGGQGASGGGTPRGGGAPGGRATPAATPAR